MGDNGCATDWVPLEHGERDEYLPHPPWAAAFTCTWDRAAAVRSEQQRRDSAAGSTNVPWKVGSLPPIHGPT